MLFLPLKDRSRQSEVSERAGEAGAEHDEVVEEAGDSAGEEDLLLEDRLRSTGCVCCWLLHKARMA